MTLSSDLKSWLSAMFQAVVILIFAVLLWLLFIIYAAKAADYAVILTEPERAAMIEALDIATRAQGLAIVRKTLPLWEKLVTAPVVTDQRPADQKPEEKKP